MDFSSLIKLMQVHKNSTSLLTSFPSLGEVDLPKARGIPHSLTYGCAFDEEA
jgi:hypothetical protein